MEQKPKQIQVVELVRTLFEYIHGNMGLLKFSVDSLQPDNGHGTDSDKWKVVCSFYKTLGSSQPTMYEVDVDLKTKTVSMKAIKGEVANEPEEKKVFRMVESNAP